MVIGAGAAEVMAAGTEARNGKRVLLIEKMVYSRDREQKKKATDRLRSEPAAPCKKAGSPCFCARFVLSLRPYVSKREV